MMHIGGDEKCEDVLALFKGAPVFVRTGTDVHSLGTLLEKPSAAGGAASDCLVQLSDEESPRRVALRDLAPADSLTDSSESKEDICSLSFLHEPAVTRNLRVRYERNEIYTRAGPVLVAVNPFQTLAGLYSVENAARYAAASPPSPLPPHIFETASRAYSAMVASGRSQSIIISGESGAGKTESAKLALRQVAALAAAAAASSSSAAAASAAGDEFAALEAAILATNPVLEAFGNAKTSRNDNSSRFGKLVELLYVEKRGAFAVSGARLSTCLLERSRLVARPEGERNFHILYQLVAGAGKELREELRLPPPLLPPSAGAAGGAGESSPPPPPLFRYLSGGPGRIDGVDDAEEFRKVSEALSAVGVGLGTQAEQRPLWRALAAVLHLGDVDFVPAEGGEACSVSRGAGDSSSSSSPLETAAALLGVRAEELERVLTTREITAGGERGREGGKGCGGNGKGSGGGDGRRESRGGGGDRVARPLRPEEARSSRDALAKAVYSSLFDWLVARINSRLAPPEEEGGGAEEQEEKEEAGAAAAASEATGATAAAAPSSPSISLLDIYGFECFQENGFEQLCINYANEHLQAQFNSVLLALEQEAYEGEGVDFSRVDWRSNEETLAALDARPGNVAAGASSSSSPRFAVGLLALLDEACLIPGGTDAGFGLRVAEVLAGGGGGSSSSCSSAASTPSAAKASSSAAAFASTAVVAGCPAGAGASFSVAHAAGTVSYATSGFLSKNKDVVSAEALALLSLFSTEPLLKEIAEAATTGPRSKSAGSSSSTKNSNGNSATLVSALRHQLRSLLRRLDASQLHFVRCIKPNSSAAPSSFDAALVAHQLRCAGVAEVARVARQGFPTRAPYAELAKKFSALAFPPPSSRGGGRGLGEGLDNDDDRAIVAALLSSPFLKSRLLGGGEDAYALGRTKVFMRAGVLGALEAELRVRSSAATAISSRVRGSRERARFLRLRRSAVVIQAAARGKAARKLLEEKKERKRREEEEERQEEKKRRAEEEEEERAKAAAKVTVERSSSSSSSPSSTLSAATPASDAASVLRGAEKLVEAADAEAAAAARRAASGGAEAKKSWLPKVPLSLRRSSRSNEGGGGAAVAPRPPAASSGAAAAEVALWETYAERLEAQVASLLRTDRALRGSLAAARADSARALTAAATAAAGDGSGGKKKKSCFSSSRPSSAAASSSPTLLQSAAAVAEHAAALRALDALRESLGKREALFEDDAAFLAEVASGAAAAAPGLYLREETRRLRKRFATFVSSFAGKMEATEVVVLGAAEAKRATEEDAAAAAVGGGGGGRGSSVAAASPLLPEEGKIATAERQGAAPVVSLEARAAW